MVTLLLKKDFKLKCFVLETGLRSPCSQPSLNNLLINFLNVGIPRNLGANPTIFEFTATKPALK
jgi:hypothetical protein